MDNKRNGFTLIELLITITILSVLVGILLPNLTDLRKKARDQRRKSDLKAIAQAFESYKINQTPPTYPAALPLQGNQLIDSNGIVYMQKVPQDPLYSTSTADKYVYRYERNPIDALDYSLQACLEMTNDLERGGNILDSGTNQCFHESPSNTQVYTLTAP